MGGCSTERKCGDSDCQCKKDIIVKENSNLKPKLPINTRLCCTRKPCRGLPKFLIFLSIAVLFLWIIHP